jgi:hypothetical protein
MHEFFQNFSWILSVLTGCLWVTIGLLLAGLGWSTLRISLLLLGLALATAPLGVAAWFGLPVWPLAAIVGTVAASALLLDRASRVRLKRARQAGLYPAEGQGDDSDVEKLLGQGEKLLAIRLYRELHGTDLKTARCRVETLQQKQAPGLQS